MLRFRVSVQFGAIGGCRFFGARAAAASLPAKLGSNFFEQPPPSIKFAILREHAPAF